MIIHVAAFDTERILIVLILGATRVVLASNAAEGIVLVSKSGRRESNFIDLLDIQLDANEGLAIKLAPDVDISSINQQGGSE